MHGDVSVPLLKSIVLLDVVKVIPSDDTGAVHLHLDDGASQHAASDGDLPGEGTLLVDVVSIFGLSRGLEAKSRADDESALGSWKTSLPVQENGWLLLESSLVLIGHDDYHTRLSLVEVNQAIIA